MTHDFKQNPGVIPRKYSMHERMNIMRVFRFRSRRADCFLRRNARRIGLPCKEEAMRPKTLLELAGAAAMPSRLADAAVVVIDAQRDYVDGKLPLTGMPQALDAISQLLKRARSEGAPIVHIVHEGKAGGAVD